MIRVRVRIRVIRVRVRRREAVRQQAAHLVRLQRLQEGELVESVGVEGSYIGDFGGSWLEHTRRWPGAQWPGLFVGSVSSQPEPPGAP